MASPGSGTSQRPPFIIDVHTHMYPPSYISLLSKRSDVPYVYQPEDSSIDPRLIILPSDDDKSRPPSQRGRPIDGSYSSFHEKLRFMKQHGIDVSIVSLANPWLDWLPSVEALSVARAINDDLNEACVRENERAAGPTLYAFACLPLSASTSDIVAEVGRLKTLSHVKGIVMGTTGLGAGLDDHAMEPIWSALAATKTLVFLHPHYGLPDSAFGGSDTIARSGHVLPLALGFPLETTIAITRMYLSGVFDRHHDLQMLLAHSGGTLPFLAGRIESCIEHEREFDINGGDRTAPSRSIWEILRSNLYLDAVIYGKPGLKAAIEAGGVDRVMFGTDHPFFPPLKKSDGADPDTGKWLSVLSNGIAIDTATEGDEQAARMILGENAARVLGIDM